MSINIGVMQQLCCYDMQYFEAISTLQFGLQKILYSSCILGNMYRWQIKCIPTLVLYSAVTWASWLFKSLATQSFVPQFVFVPTGIKEYIKATLWGESTGDQCFPPTKLSPIMQKMFPCDDFNTASSNDKYQGLLDALNWRMRPIH